MKISSKLYAYAGTVTSGVSSLLAGRALAASSPFENNSNGLQPNGNLNLSTTSTTLNGTVASLGDVVINVIFLIALILAVAYLVYSGIQYIMSAGNPEKTKTARAGVINSIIGIIIIAAAYTIIRFALNIGSGLKTVNS
ncbi:hypothetical protein KGQ71_00455 [Patescibacteria group bacterium]|nr:hypothetical protein [Patescibacteria group bacterium]